MSASAVDSRVTLAIAAIDASDWGTALTHLFAAKALLAGLPDRKTGSGFELRYDRAAIDALIADVKSQQTQANAASSSGLFGQQKIIYVRPDC